ncbi:MAG: cyclic nucleotide-binding domain-containing protein [Spirochaetales bacterium]|nr:cyclic nucleotide-binding domain-containing protein [Spirochaetales bacterium]
MNYIVIISTDKKLNAIITKTVADVFQDEFILQFPPTEKEALELLEFELPELVVCNLSDPLIDTEAVARRILADSWLHNFGIVGIYDGIREEESDLLEKYKGINLLALLEQKRTDHFLGRTLKIIYENRQLIFSDWLTEKLINRVSGSFRIKNIDFTMIPVYAALLAMSMVRMGWKNKEERLDLQLALSELIINAIEHGNCAISYDEKNRAMREGLDMADLIAFKNEDPDISRKVVLMDWDFSDREVRINITDSGNGFDVAGFVASLKNRSSEELHGRGILLAKSISDKLIFNKKGNRVSLVFNKKADLERAAPVGFSMEEEIRVKKGDVVMIDGEVADCLYYITSGKYSVYHKGKAVGTITPSDIFMGEMAFLLSNTRTATVVADREGKLIKIPRESFISVIKEYPQYSMFISKLLAKKLVQANESSTSS